MSRQITRLKNLYARLGIARTAKHSDIKKAYYDLSKECHPDRNEGSARAAKRFHEITEAYKVLGNETSRQEYDKSAPYDGRPSMTPQQAAYLRFYESNQPDPDLIAQRERAERERAEIREYTPRFKYTGVYKDPMEYSKARHEREKQNEILAKRAIGVIIAALVGVFVYRQVTDDSSGYENKANNKK